MLKPPNKKNYVEDLATLLSIGAKQSAFIMNGRRFG